MRKKGSIVVDILEVDLDVSVAHQAVASLVLGEDREPPLWPTIWLVPVQRLKVTKLSLLAFESYQLSARKLLLGNNLVKQIK